VITPKVKEIVAYHEAGHALIAESRPNADKVARISIIPRGVGALGYTRQVPADDRFLMTRAELLDRLDVLLGGRTAEELVFGDVSTGAQNDLQHATDLARDMVTRFGMAEAVGLATYEEPRRALFLDVPVAPAREYSEATAAVIDTEVGKLLAKARQRALETLTRQRESLESLAGLLKIKEVVDRSALLEILGAPAAEPATRAES
jgi:cell division protease FtsH